MDTKKRIEEYFAAHKEEMLRDIGTLIAIPSVQGDEQEGMPFGKEPAEALHAAMKMAEDMGFPVKNYENYAAAVDLCDLPRQLDILAHLDVVPAGNGWSVTEPFLPLIREGRIYGRGSSDDKGPAIAALYAMKAVKDLCIPLKRSARLVLGTNEETGSRDLTHYYEQEPEAPMSFSPDAEFPVINIEKGRYSIWLTANYPQETALPHILSARGGVVSNVVPDAAEAILEGFSEEILAEQLSAAAERTGLRFEAKRLEDGKTVVSVHGACAHASTPEEGNNAVTGLLDLLTSLPVAPSAGFEKLLALHRLFPHGDCRGEAAGVAMSDECSGELTLSVDIFRFEEGELHCFFDSRTPVCATNENLRDVFCVKAKSLGLMPEDKEVAPAHHVPEDSPFIQVLLRCYEQYSGLPGKCMAIGGGTYAHRLKNGVGFGCILPGTDTHMHGPDEFAEIDELLLSAKIFAQVIIDLCS